MVAEDYRSVWLWAGVKATDTVRRADTVYILDGEIRGEPTRFMPLRVTVPKAKNPHIWLVVRTDTLDWPDAAGAALASRLDQWSRAGNRVDGLQIDFDAATRGLGRYAEFLKRQRRALPARYKLSITGLMDWSAHGDPAALKQLEGIVDEVVIQTYQGRATIPGYELYFDRMRRFPIPFKVGLVENGRWLEPRASLTNPFFAAMSSSFVNPK